VQGGGPAVTEHVPGPQARCTRSRLSPARVRESGLRWESDFGLQPEEDSSCGAGSIPPALCPVGKGRTWCPCPSPLCWPCSQQDGAGGAMSVPTLGVHPPAPSRLQRWEKTPGSPAAVLPPGMRDAQPSLPFAWQREERRDHPPPRATPARGAAPSLLQAEAAAAGLAPAPHQPRSSPGGAVRGPPPLSAGRGDWEGAVRLRSCGGTRPSRDGDGGETGMGMGMGQGRDGDGDGTGMGMGQGQGCNRDGDGTGMGKGMGMGTGQGWG